MFLFVFIASCKQEVKIKNNTEINTENIEAYPLPYWNEVASKNNIIAYV